MSLTSAVRRAATINPRGTAYFDERQPVSWAQAGQRIAALAGHLETVGMQHGVRVATLASNSSRHFELLLAVWWAGGVVVPVNARLVAEEVAYILDHSGTTILAFDSMSRPTVDALIADTSVAYDLIDLDDQAGYGRALAQKQAEDAHCSDDATAAIFYTGGTTGAPKGVELTHGNFLFAALGMQRDLRHDTQTVYQHAAPLVHLADFGISMGVTLAAGTHVFLTKFSPVSFYTQLREHSVTHLLLVPTMIADVLEAPERDDRLLAQIRSISYGAAPITEALLQRAKTAFPNARFQQFYGMTESCGASCYLPSERHFDSASGPTKLTTAGQPLPGVEVAIVDSALNPVPLGTAGEIVMRGPQVMRGYWRDPQRTAETLKNGWLRSGDVGTMDDDGFVTIVDRMKDMIISGGENIYCAEVENALADHPDVMTCVVVGVPDPRWGERVHAVVIPRPGSELDVVALDTHCRERIAGYKVPRSYDFTRTSLPLSAVGKIQKHVLRQELTGSSE